MSDATTMSLRPSRSAAPLAEHIAETEATPGDLILSLPTIHCAACIGKIERVLSSMEGVRDARVNLSRKRVTIKPAPGLDLGTVIAAIDGAGFEAHELDGAMMAAVETDPEGRRLLTRLAVAGFAMMNVMLFSVAVWSGASDSTRQLFHWISAIISVPALAFSAQVFFTSAWSALRNGRLNMDVPISLAIILAALMSVYETVLGTQDVYFDAALSLTFFLLCGRYLDHRMRVAAHSAAQELSALEIPRCTRLDGAERETVNVADLHLGDRIEVLQGMRIPVDGRLITDRSEMDRSFLTGESLPISVKAGDTLCAGEINLGKPVILEVTAIGEDTTLRRMAALVETAENARNRYTALADRAAKIYAPLVHLLAVAAFVGWVMASGDVILSINIAISVLIITCPCALGLAVPAVMVQACRRLFAKGFLVKDDTALERLAECDAVVFDKTGTLTEGGTILDLDHLKDDELSVLAALVSRSAHPVSRMVAKALPADTPLAALDDIEEVPGQGLDASWRGVPIRFGRAEWCGGAESSPALRIGDAPAKRLKIRENLRPGAGAAVRALQDQGLPATLMSGDTNAAAYKVAEALGIPSVQAELRPEAKLSAIKAMQDQGAKVLMVGDGLNDTAALVAAHASISPASALDASRTAADIVLLNRSMDELGYIVATARTARLRVTQNFAIAAGYNMIAIPVALAGHATPLAAAIAMSLSSITVLLNAARIR